MSYRQRKALVLTIAWLLTGSFVYSCFSSGIHGWALLVLYAACALIWYEYFTRILFLRGSSVGLRALYRYRPVFNLIDEWNKSNKNIGFPIFSLIGWPFTLLVYAIRFVMTFGYRDEQRYWLTFASTTDTLESILKEMSEIDVENLSADSVSDDLKLPTLHSAISRAKEMMSRDPTLIEVMIMDFGDFVVDENGVQQNLVWTVKKTGVVVRTV